MRTNFKPEQLEDPKLKAADAQLRSCVHCGICTATCPTYNILRDERDGPRGRIQLIQQMLEQDLKPSLQTVAHLDRCLSCLACVSACPAGVNYPRLIDTARNHIERSNVRPPLDQLVRRALGTILPHRRLLSLLVSLARLVSPLRSLAPRQFSTMIDAAAKLPRPAKTPEPQAISATTMRIALHKGCVQEVVAPQFTSAARRVLAKLGIEAECVEGTGCCGALNHHLGQERPAHRHAQALVRDITDRETEAPFAHVLTTTSGCGAVIRDFGFQLGSPEARSIGERTRDVMDFLQEKLNVPQRASNSIRVAYHKPCSLQHAMKSADAGPALLRRLGFEVLEPDDQSCCGSAGVYNVLQPDIARMLQQQKTDALRSLKPDIIVSGNIGCLAQIASAMDVPVVHPVEVVDWALDGYVPESLRHLRLLR